VIAFQYIPGSKRTVKLIYFTGVNHIITEE
jgi:hypothetical protein